LAIVNSPTIGLVAIVIMTLPRIYNSAFSLNDAWQGFKVGEIKNLDASMAIRTRLATCRLF
jgi:hypothetical protein